MKNNNTKKLFSQYSFFNNISIRSKIVISFSIVISLLLVLAFVSYQIIADSLIRQTQENTIQLTRQTSKILEVELNEIDRLALAISRNEIIGSMVNQFDTADPIKKSYLDTEIKKVLASLIGTRNDIADIIIITNQGGTLVFPPNNSLTSLNFKALESYAYQQYLTQQKVSLWLDTYISDNQGTYIISPKVISIIKEMYVSTMIKKIGLVQINIKESYLNNLLVDLKNSSGRNLFVLGRNYNIVLNPYQLTANETTIPTNYFKKISQKNNGFFYTKINNNLNLVVFKKIESTDWLVFFTISVKNITRNIQNATKNLLLIGAFCILVGIFFSYLISQDISGALFSLEEKITDIKNGNLDIDLVLKRNDEFGRLSESFQKMVLSLKTILNSIANNSLPSSSYPQSNSNLDLNELINETQSKLKHLVNIDPLTGAYNRRFFEQYYQNELNKLADFSSYENDNSIVALGIAFVDIDNFKHINDTYGHHTGDHVLKELIKVIITHLFNHETLCRYGGEEFVIIFTKINHEKALQDLERIRTSVSEHHFYLNENIPDGHVTISMGVAFFPNDQVHCEQLIKLADQRLYLAKNTGKNRIVYH